MSTHINSIKSLETKRTKLIRELIATRHMLRGSFKRQFNRCGKQTCWCREADKGHPRDSIFWRKDTKKFEKTIPKDDIPWAKEMTKAYKRFRKIRQQLLQINEELRLLLNALEDELAENTRKLKDYL